MEPSLKDNFRSRSLVSGTVSVEAIAKVTVVVASLFYVA